MIAEISAILGTLNAVNSAVGTLKQTSNNAQGLGNALHKLSIASTAIDRVKADKARGTVLTLKDASELALAEKQVAEFERQLKDICLFSGNGDLYKRMKSLQAESKKNVAKASIQARRKKAQRQKLIEEISLGVLMFVILGSMAAAGVYLAIKYKGF